MKLGDTPIYPGPSIYEKATIPSLDKVYEVRGITLRQYYIGLFMAARISAGIMLSSNADFAIRETDALLAKLEKVRGTNES